MPKHKTNSLTVYKSSRMLSYGNELNKFCFKNMTKLGIKVAFAILYKAKEQKQLKLVFNVNDLKELVPYERKAEPFAIAVYRVLTKMQGLTVECIDPENPEKLISRIVFPEVTLDRKTGEVTVTISTFMQDILNNDQFTLIDLTLQGLLTSKLSKPIKIVTVLTFDCVTN